jgi:radical SAM protein with 4Fe4S-binding SPASM domain
MSAAELLARLAQKGKKRPFDAMLQITERCNYRCSHCYQSHSEGADELDLPEIVRILDELVEAGILFLTLSGGEIFVRRDLPEILAATQARGFSVKLYTTGYHLDDAKADMLYARGVHHVELSLYGSHEAVHEAITLMPTSFERTVNAARLLRARGIGVTIKTPLFKENARDVAALDRLAAELDCGFRVTTTVSVTDQRDHAPLKHRTSDDELRDFFRWRIDQLGPEVMLRQVRDKPLDESPCGAGKSSMRIDSTGKVYGCAALTHVAGDVRHQHVLEAWNDSTELARIRQVTWGDLQGCNVCELRPFCNRCHADAELEDGRLLGPSTAACRNAVAMRDVMKERGLVPAEHDALPPPLSGAWQQLPDHEGHRLRVVR